MFAHLIIGIGKDRKQFRGLRINDPCTVYGKSKGRRLRPHLLLVTQQGNVADVPKEGYLCRPEDSLLRAFGQNDMHPLLFGPLR